MSLEGYLRPGRRLLAVAIAFSMLGLAAPVVVQAHEGDHDSDDNDKDKKEVRVYRSGDEDKDDDNEGDTKAFRYRVERADAKGGYLGVRVQDITPGLMKARDLKTDDGALVNRVEEDSPADEAGIRRGDVIIEVNGDDVEDSGDLVDAVRGTEPGSKVDVVVLRDGSRKTFKVEVVKRPHDMMMGTPGFQWRGQHGMDEEQMKELRARIKEIDPEKMKGDFDMRGPESRREMEELRQELRELKQELQDLKAELRESRSRNRLDD